MQNGTIFDPLISIFNTNKIKGIINTIKKDLFIIMSSSKEEPIKKMCKSFFDSFSKNNEKTIIFYHEKWLLESNFVGFLNIFANAIINSTFSGTLIGDDIWNKFFDLMKEEYNSFFKYLFFHKEEKGKIIFGRYKNGIASRTIITEGIAISLLEEKDVEKFKGAKLYPLSPELEIPGVNMREWLALWKNDEKNTVELFKFISLLEGDKIIIDEEAEPPCIEDTTG